MLVCLSSKGGPIRSYQDYDLHREPWGTDKEDLCEPNEGKQSQWLLTTEQPQEVKASAGLPLSL